MESPGSVGQNDGRDVETSFVIVRPYPPCGDLSEIRQNMQKTLWSNQHARSMLFDETALKYLATLFLECFRFPNLTNLMISIRDFGYEEQQAFSRLSQLKLPALQTLRMDSLLLRGEAECALLYATVFKFVALHVTVVKYLTLRLSFRPFSVLKQAPKLAWPLGQSELQNLREDFEMLHLEELTIFLDDYEGQENFDLGYQVMLQQTSLLRLEVQVGKGDANLSYRHIAQVLRQNRRTLRHFTLAKVPMDSAVDEIKIVFIALAELENLESLRLFTFVIHSLECVQFIQFPHLRFLDLAGAISPQVLLEVTEKFPALEELQFSNLKSDFGSLQNEWRDCLATFLLRLPRLHVVRWYSPHLCLDFLKDDPTLVVKTSLTNSFASVIFVVKNKNV